MGISNRGPKQIDCNLALVYKDPNHLSSKPYVIKYVSIQSTFDPE